MVSTTACNFLALRHLRLDQTVSVAFLAPLIVALLAGPFLGEWVGWRRLVAIFVGFIGVLIVVHPGIGGLHPAFAFAFGGMLAYAFFMLLTRYLAAYDAPLVMLFYSILLGTFALAPFAIWQWVWPQTPFEWLLLLCARRVRRHWPLPVHPRLPACAGVQRGAVPLRADPDHGRPSALPCSATCRTCGRSSARA